MIVRSFVSATPFVWSEDPALDTKSPAYDHAKFNDTGDLAHVPAVEGGKVTVFEIKPVSRAQQKRCYAMSGYAQFDEAIACGLRGVRGGLAFGFPFEVKTVKVNGEDRVDPEVLDNLNDPILWAEMGSRILEISRLFPQKGSR
jgi:hypothetical protein